MGSPNIFNENKGSWQEPTGSRFVHARAGSGGVAAGDVVTFDATLSTASIFQVLNTSTTAEDQSVVGVATEAIASSAYGTIQIYGHNTTVKVDGTTTSVAIGDNICQSVTAAKAQKFEAITVSPANGGARLGICMATVASGSDTTFACFIDPR